MDAAETDKPKADIATEMIRLFTCYPCAGKEGEFGLILLAHTAQGIHRGVSSNIGFQLSGVARQLDVRCAFELLESTEVLAPRTLCESAIVPEIVPAHNLFNITLRDTAKLGDTFFFRC